MEKIREFLKRKDIQISLRRYGIDALGAMAQGLFCSLLIGTIINTIGTQFHIPFLTVPVATVAGVEYTVGGIASAMSGPAMAVAIGYALKCPPLVLFSMISVGFASNALGGAGGPLAVLFVAILWRSAARRCPRRPGWTYWSPRWSPSARAYSCPGSSRRRWGARRCGWAMSSCGPPSFSPS